MRRSRAAQPDQDAPGALVFARAGDDWVGHVLGGGDVLTMPDIGASVPVAEFHDSGGGGSSRAEA